MLVVWAGKCSRVENSSIQDFKPKLLVEKKSKKPKFMHLDQLGFNSVILCEQASGFLSAHKVVLELGP